jgi:chromosome segregation protein
MTEVNAGIEKTAQLLRTKQTELASLTALVANFRAERNARDEELQTLQLASAKNENRISDLEDDLSGIAIRREATNEHLRELDTAITEARHAHDKAEAAVAAARAATDTEQKTANLLLAQTQTTEETLQHHRQLLTEAEKSLIAIERALAEKESRLEVLKQLNEEGEGLAQGSQAVLKGLDDPKRIQSALAGALVAQLEVVPKFVAAIEATLGRNLHTIVLQNAELASQIIATLTEKKLGQTALFIPELSEPAQEPKQNGLPEDALAWAIEMVNAPESLRPLVQKLLRDVAIFVDLDQAIRFKKTTPRLAVATLAGEFISVEGIIFGGGSGAQTESLLARKARISILAAEHSVVSAQRDTIRQKRDEAKNAVDKTATYLEETRAKHRAADLAQSAAGNKIALLEHELEEATRKVDNLVSEKTTLRQQIEAADERVAELEKELAEARKGFAEQHDRHQAVEATRKEAIAQEEKATEQLNELRLALATEQQRHGNLIEQRQPMTAREAELAETINARRTDIANFEKRLATQADESKSAEAAIHQENARRDEVKATVAGLSDKRAEYLSTLNETEAELRGARNLLNGLHDRRATQQVRESQLQMKIDNLAEHVERRYHVDLRRFAADEAAFSKTLNVQLKRRDKMEGGAPATPPTEGSPELAPPVAQADVAELEKIVIDLTRQLDNMGPVNLDAVQEYDALEERYRFLEAQNNDLTASRRELLDVIARINSTTQKLFAETFALVRVNFREMFAELFGGGRADLSLMDESDLLNCGIEITAKPPGKQLQSISLLSGGERTMTAVALLFAIYMVRPSPFCVLDELDAPLDESNINRFIRVLERFVAQSQFIIITHNKRTIAKADILYGVTMEERGVSKLVGMKMGDRPEAAERAPDAISGNVTQRQFAMAENSDAEHKSSFAAR